MANYQWAGSAARYVAPVLLLTSVLAAAPASAGALKFKWWQSERFVRELALTTDQQARLEGIFKSSWPSLEGCKGDLDRLDSELSRLIADGTTPETQVIQQIDRVEASRSALGRARSLMLYRMYRVLTPDQRVKLKALNEQVEKEQQQGTPKPPSPR
jgi:Spy/CpxP family protein refolding chaperone